MNCKRAGYQEFPAPPFCKYHSYCFLSFFNINIPFWFHEGYTTSHAPFFYHVLHCCSFIGVMQTAQILGY